MTGPNDTKRHYRTAPRSLSRWRHGFESRWGAPTSGPRSGSACDSFAPEATFRLPRWVRRHALEGTNPRSRQVTRLRTMHCLAHDRSSAARVELAALRGPSSTVALGVPPTAQPLGKGRCAMERDAVHAGSAVKPTEQCSTRVRTASARHSDGIAADAARTGRVEACRSHPIAHPTGSVRR